MLLLYGKHLKKKKYKRISWFVFKMDVSLCEVLESFRIESINCFQLDPVYLLIRLFLPEILPSLLLTLVTK